MKISKLSSKVFTQSKTKHNRKNQPKKNLKITKKLTWQGLRDIPCLFELQVVYARIISNISNTWNKAVRTGAVIIPRDQKQKIEMLQVLDPIRSSRLGTLW